MKVCAAAMLIVLTLTPAARAMATSSCWVLTNLRGQAMYATDGFKPTKDGFSRTNPRITLVLNGLKTTATGDNVALVQAGDYMAVGAIDTPNASIIETYSIDPSINRVFYTKSAVMRDPLFASMSGTKSFVGTAEPCQ